MIAHHASPHQVTRINSHNSTGVHLHSCLFFMVLKKNENCYILELFFYMYSTRVPPGIREGALALKSISLLQRQDILSRKT